MASEAPKMTRDGTMEVTAKEGIAFLEKESPDLAEKVKKMKEDEAQKPANGSGDAPAAENGTPKVPRDNTMVQTAEEGIAFLKRHGAQELIENEGLELLLTSSELDLKKPELVKSRTMTETAKEGKKFLEKEGGVNQDAKTRGQEKEIEEAKGEKEATKRAADDKNNETDEAKKQKVEDENGNGETQEEKPAKVEAKK